MSAERETGRRTGPDGEAAAGDRPRDGWSRGLRALLTLSAQGSGYGGPAASPAPTAPAAFFGALTRTVAELTGAERAAFWALQPDGTFRIQPDAHGFPADAVAALAATPACVDAAGEASGVTRGDPVTEVARRRRGDAPGQVPWLDPPGVREAIVVPWCLGGQRLGLLGVYDAVGLDGFTEDDVWVTRVASLSAGLLWREQRAAGRVADIEREHAVRLREYAERTSALERTKSNILNLAAHELRGPLAVIRGYLSLLEDGSIEGEEEVARVRPILSAKANQIAALVDEMLETARLEDGRVELGMERLDLRDVVQEVVDTTTAQLAAGQWLVVQKGADPVMVMGDRLRLVSIVSNLVANAIKYSPGGGPIRVSVAAERAAAVVRVIDRGMGISDADLPTLFTRFGRILNDENRSIAGTGLGLYLCRELALMHGGDVAVESQPGVGSAFDLVLPRLLSGREARGAPAGGYDIARFDLSDMIHCGAALRRIGTGSASFEQAANRVVRHLRDGLREGADGRRAAALVRLFRALPYSRLDPERQAIARREMAATLSDGQAPGASTLCLCLVATAGERKEWNSPRASARHRVIPLPRGGRWSPMVTRLVDDLGVDPERTRDPELFLDLVERTCNVFHVPEALSSPYVPDQDDFVRPYGIRSVLGFGGVLAAHDLYAVVVFSTVPIPPGCASLFRAISHSVKLALQAFSGDLSAIGLPRPTDAPNGRVSPNASAAGQAERR